ncbi:MATE family efflux transporter [Frankia sp. AgKG'84/4]
MSERAETRADTPQAPPDGGLPGTGPGRDDSRAGLDRDPAWFAPTGRGSRGRPGGPGREQRPDSAEPHRHRRPEPPGSETLRLGHGYGDGSKFGYGFGQGAQPRAGRGGGPSRGPGRWDTPAEPHREGTRPEAAPRRRVEPFDHEQTQIIRGLHGRRVPRSESYQIRHQREAEGLIPMSGPMTGEFFLGGMFRQDGEAASAPQPAGPAGPAASTLTAPPEPADYGLADLSEEIGAGGRHRAERTTRGSSRSRAIWTLVDQVLSSGTNAVMSFVIARSVSTSEFGAFGVAFAIFSLMIGFSKAAGTAPLGIRFADAQPRVFRAAAAAGVGTAFAVGLLSGVVTLLVGLGVGGSVGAALVAMGLVFPALLLQDAWRQVFFAEGRPAAAALNDGVWAVVQFVAIFALIVRDVSTSWAMLLAWGGAAAVAAVLGIYQAGFGPATGQVRTWLVDHRDINGYMSAEYLTVQGAQQASTLLLGALNAIDIVGALRGVQTLLGPTTILAVGIVSWAIPEFSRRKDMSPAARLRAAYALSAVIVSVGVIWGTIFLVLPESVGHALLGDTWAQTHHLLALSIVQQAGPAATVGPACMLYALGKAKLTFRANLILAPQLLVYPVIGLELGGGTGAVVGYIAAFWITVPFWFLLLRSATLEDDESAADSASEAVPSGSGEPG